MQANIANQVCTAFGIPAAMHPGYAAFAVALPDALGNLLRARAADLLATVQFNAQVGGPQLGRLKQVTNYLGDVNGRCAAFGVDAPARAEFLYRYNLALRPMVAALPLNPMLTPVRYDSDPAVATVPFDVERLRELITEVIDTNTHLAAGYIAYCNATQDAWLVLQQMREEVIKKGGMTTTIYLTIHFFHQNLLDFSALRAPNVMLIDRARRAAPPNTPFPGFMRWGVGNGGTVANNLRNHFLKHVLDADPLGEALSWTDELRLWWNELNIVLTQGNAQTWLDDGGTGYASVANLFVAGANGTVTLPLAEVQTFLQRLKLANAMSERFRNEMYRAYGHFYRDRALTAGRAMTDKMVHCRLHDRDAISVSGAEGTLFVVGRFEGFVLGISACYFLRDRAAKLAERVCIWPLP